VQAYCGIYYRINLVVAVLRGSIGRVIAVLRDRLLLLSLLVERFVLTLINEDYYYYIITTKKVAISMALPLAGAHPASRSQLKLQDP